MLHFGHMRHCSQFDQKVGGHSPMVNTPIGYDAAMAAAGNRA